MKCSKLECPYSMHCNHFPVPEMHLNNCVYADEITIASRKYVQQIIERNKKLQMEMLNYAEQIE